MAVATPNQVQCGRRVAAVTAMSYRAALCRLLGLDLAVPGSQPFERRGDLSLLIGQQG